MLNTLFIAVLIAVSFPRCSALLGDGLKRVGS